MAATFSIIHKTVASAGTAEQLTATSTLVSSILIQAKGGNNGGTGANTGKVFIGPSTVTNSGDTGIQLAVPSSGATPSSIRIDSGDSSNLFDLSAIYVAVAVDGEGVVVLYNTR